MLFPLEHTRYIQCNGLISRTPGIGHYLTTQRQMLLHIHQCEYGLFPICLCNSNKSRIHYLPLPAEPTHYLSFLDLEFSL
jgi:hypothetical protein